MESPEPVVQVPPQVTKDVNESLEKEPSKLFRNILVGALLLAVLVAAAIGGGYVVLNSGKNKDKSVNEQSSNSDENTDIVLARVLNVTVPAENADVDGDVNLVGIASSDIKNITIKIFDEQDNLLGERTVEISSNWNAKVAITKSPSSSVGYILVYPATEDEDSDLAQRINVGFESAGTVTDRIVLETPLQNQMMTDGKVNFRGSMQNFFEATMSVRLTDNAGNELFADIIMPNGDNYEQFAEFEKEFNVTDIPAGIKEGKWELFEVSAMDGSETVLLTVNVKFR